MLENSSKAIPSTSTSGKAVTGGAGWATWTTRPEGPSYDPAAEVVELCRELIRIDTSNYGDGDGPGERKAAEYVAGLLDEVGIESTLFEGSTGARLVVARWGGGDGRPPLLLHGHLDVVPAAAEDWQVDPFAGEIQDGFVWGRGAVDMKDFDAMLLCVVRARAGAGAAPDREMVLCFTADEEAGGHKGAEVMIEEHADEFADCTEAVGEVGGFTATVRGRRIYLIEAAEKGMAWMRLTARGRAGHGSMINDDNAVTRLAGAVARIGAHQWPVRLTPTMEVLLATVADLAGTEATPENAEALIEEFGTPRGCSARSSATPPTRRCSARATRSTSSPPRPRRTSTAASCRASRTSSSPPWPSSPAAASRSTSCRKQPRGRRRTTATWWPR